MSGPYDHQQVAGQFTGQAAAAGNRQRAQRAGDSSTSLSSASSANVYKANAAGAVQGAGAAQVAGGYGQFLQGAGGYGQFVQGAGGSGQFGGSVATVTAGPRRQGRFHRETYRLPDPGVGHVRQVRRRLATPEPDTIERVYLQRAANEIIEEITEVPTTPPPRIQERTIVEPAGPPQVIKRVIRVPPRSGGGYYQGQQSVGAAGGNFQASGHLLSAGSYGNVQQAGVAHQQSYGGAAGLSGGYGSFGGAAGFAGGQQQQQQGFGFGGFSSQGFQQSPIGLPGAFCFQV